MSTPRSTARAEPELVGDRPEQRLVVHRGDLDILDGPRSVAGSPARRRAGSPSRTADGCARMRSRVEDDPEVALPVDARGRRCRRPGGPRRRRRGRRPGPRGRPGPRRSGPTRRRSRRRPADPVPRRNAAMTAGSVVTGTPELVGPDPPLVAVRPCRHRSRPRGRRTVTGRCVAPLAAELLEQQQRRARGRGRAGRRGPRRSSA